MNSGIEKFNEYLKTIPKHERAEETMFFLKNGRTKREEKFKNWLISQMTKKNQQ